jgi:hypothetical protein
MSMPPDFNLDSAEAAYAVANTPLYLLRKLQGDPVSQSLKERMTADDILTAFRAAATTEPQTLRDLVLPYVYLAALSLQQELGALRKSTEVVPRPEYKWLDYIRRVLIENYRPTSRVVVPGPVEMPRLMTARSSASTNTAIVRKG